MAKMKRRRRSAAPRVDVRPRPPRAREPTTQMRREAPRLMSTSSCCGPRHVLGTELPLELRGSALADSKVGERLTCDSVTAVDEKREGSAARRRLTSELRSAVSGARL